MFRKPRCTNKALLGKLVWQLMAWEEYTGWKSVINIGQMLFLFSTTVRFILHTTQVIYIFHFIYKKQRVKKEKKSYAKWSINSHHIKCRVCTKIFCSCQILKVLKDVLFLSNFKTFERWWQHTTATSSMKPLGITNKSLPSLSSVVILADGQVIATKNHLHATKMNHTG